MKNLFTLLAETERELVLKQIEQKTLPSRFLVFNKAKKLKTLDLKIGELQKNKESLEQLVETLEAGELHFKTQDLEFPLDRQLHRQGFYLIKRTLVGDLWHWVYRFGKS